MRYLKIFLPILAGVCFCLSSQAQKSDPVHVSFSIVPVKEKTYELHITATIDEGWHIYSQTQPEEAVAQPTVITIAKNPLVTVAAAKPKEIGEKEKYTDAAAGIVQYHYERKVEFVQTITLKTKVKTTLTGTVMYQACTNEMCLMPKTVPFSVGIQL